jgi:DNA-binding transcriptional LysR family regulator
MESTAADDLTLELSPEASGLNLKQLFYFHAVVTEGSFAGAAKKLGVTQPSVSEQIKNLEQYLGTVLLERRPDGVRPNAQGRRIYEHTRVMFRSARRLLQEIAPDRVSDRLVLEIGLCPTISRTFATDRLLALFRMQRVLPRIRHGRYDSLLQSLINGELDMVLSENRPSRADEGKVGVRELYSSPLTFVASPALAEGVKSVPADLVKLPFIGYTRDSRYRWDVDGAFREIDAAPQLIAEADDVVLLLEAATQGVGVVALPRIVAAERIASGQLVELGRVGAATSSVFAHFRQTDPAQVVREAVEVLLGPVANAAK